MNKAVALAAAGTVALGLKKVYRLLLRPSFTNRIVLVTGGSRGLGLAMARRFAEEGAKLVLVARTEEDLIDAARELEQAGAEVMAIAADLTLAEEAQRVVDLAVRRFRTLDVLVHAAGVIQVGPLEHQTDEDFREAMDVHLWSVHHLTQAALPHLLKSDFPRIVNVTSVGGEMAVPHMAPYAASKFALVGYSDTLRAELAPQKVRVTTVSPGLMRTGSHVNALFKGQREKEYAWFSMLAGNPLLSTSADASARKIIDACRYGKPALVITLPAKLAKAAEGIAPNTVARVNALVERLLPAPTANGDEARPGRESQPAVSPSPLTYAADRNVQRFNE